ncbi:hypothetical protein IP86_19095 [Rhodopseudomonas sp. AAP120]|uniref:hypothetical protein n=1 Tax=Rhodopseudomonas sp. AAP120 TaxID=1523430 RepID=UPI0006B9A377|nr:hypothetical protein [Rhodopseudomonas sp. AAP120]KPF95519.1 hypothetical protein IP86_19095 [Rhodopseudomonas sp. AAP120]
MSIKIKTAWWPARTGLAARRAEARIAANDNLRGGVRRPRRPALELHWHLSPTGCLVGGWSAVPSSDDAGSAEAGSAGSRPYHPPSRAA